MKKTVEKVQSGNFEDVGPEFGRTPDVQRLFGLKRGTLYNLSNDEKIRGFTLRVRGEKSGVRLWDMESIRSYLREQMAAANVSTQ